MTRPSETTTRHRVRRPHGGLGERVRTLRVNAGLTQTALAGDRFSKEYVSQIERGKTRPTQETIEWLAQRLGVDAGFLASGVSADERGRIETALARAEALIQNHEYAEALAQFRTIRPSVTYEPAMLPARPALITIRTSAWPSTCSTSFGVRRPERA